jgi:hypothetical protein
MKKEELAVTVAKAAEAVGRQPEGVEETLVEAGPGSGGAAKRRRSGGNTQASQRAKKNSAATTEELAEMTEAELRSESPRRLLG